MNTKELLTRITNIAFEAALVDDEAIHRLAIDDIAAELDRNVSEIDNRLIWIERQFGKSSHVRINGLNVYASKKERFGKVTVGELEYDSALKQFVGTVSVDGEVVGTTLFRKGKGYARPMLDGMVAGACRRACKRIAKTQRRDHNDGK